MEAITIQSSLQDPYQNIMKKFRIEISVKQGGINFNVFLKKDCQWS